MISKITQSTNGVHLIVERSKEESQLGEYDVPVGIQERIKQALKIGGGA